MNLLHHQRSISLLSLFSASIIKSFLFFGCYIGLYFSRFDPKLEQPEKLELIAYVTNTQFQFPHPESVLRANLQCLLQTQIFNSEYTRLKHTCTLDTLRASSRSALFSQHYLTRQRNFAFAFYLRKIFSMP